MKIKVHFKSDAMINGKVKTLTVGEHNVSDHVARKLIKNGVASEVLFAAAKTVKAKAVSDEA